MLPGVILPPAGLSGLGRFEKGTLCSVCLNGNRQVIIISFTINEEFCWSVAKLFYM